MSICQNCKLPQTHGMHYSFSGPRCMCNWPRAAYAGDVPEMEILKAKVAKLEARLSVLEQKKEPQ